MTRFTTRSRDRPLTWPARERVYKARWTSRPQTLARHGSSGEHSRCSVSHLLSSFCLLSLLLPFLFIFFISHIFLFYISSFPFFDFSLSAFVFSSFLSLLLFSSYSPTFWLPHFIPLFYFLTFLKAICGKKSKRGKTGKLRNYYIWNQRLLSSEERGLCENIAVTLIAGMLLIEWISYNIRCYIRIVTVLLG